MKEFVEIPDGVELIVNEKEVVVKGPKGEIKKDFSNPVFDAIITIKNENKKFTIDVSSDRKKLIAFKGTIFAHVSNMIKGVTEGFTYKMKVIYTHFPMTIEVKNDRVEVKNFFGEKGFRKAKIVGDVKVKATKENIEITGIDIEDVSQTAANIEQSCQITKKDKRIFHDGIYITEKVKK